MFEMWIQFCWKKTSWDEHKMVSQIILDTDHFGISWEAMAMCEVSEQNCAHDECKFMFFEIMDLIHASDSWCLRWLSNCLHFHHFGDCMIVSEVLKFWNACSCFSLFDFTLSFLFIMRRWWIVWLDAHHVTDNFCCVWELHTGMKRMSCRWLGQRKDECATKFMNKIQCD